MIQKGDYLAFQTHSKSKDRGNWYINQDHYSNEYLIREGSNERYFWVDDSFHDNFFYAFYFNNPFDIDDKASFGWRVKRLKQ